MATRSWWTAWLERRWRQSPPTPPASIKLTPTAIVNPAAMARLPPAPIAPVDPLHAEIMQAYRSYQADSIGTRATWDGFARWMAGRTRELETQIAALEREIIALNQDGSYIP